MAIAALHAQKTDATLGDRIESYFDTLNEGIMHAMTTDRAGQIVPVSAAIDWAMRAVLAAHARGNKIMFIGNGGSAAIASHCTTDYLKNGELRTICFNDGAQLTCLSNDLGYDNVFATPIAMHAVKGDLLIAISSSGKSASITKAVEAARARGCEVLTLSGFGEENPLRRMGDMNIYLPSTEYGFVEIGHLAYCHIILDLIMADRARHS